MTKTHLSWNIAKKLKRDISIKNPNHQVDIEKTQVDEDTTKTSLFQRN